MRTQEEREAEAERNRRRLQQAEAAALALLLSHRKEAVSYGLKRGFSIPRIGHQVEKQIASGIAQSRILSRATGITQITRELEPLGIELAPVKSLAHEVHGDLYRSQRYANSYARQWVKKAEGETVAQAAKVASEGTLSSLTRTAITESSQAFGDGRAKALEGLPVYEGTPNGNAGHVAHSLLKVWDATLDKQTCPICAAADGTIVGIRESFPHGTPGAVHPNCRCSWTALSFEERGDQGYIEPKEPAKLISLPTPAAKPLVPTAKPPEPIKPATKPAAAPVKAPRAPKPKALPKNAQLRQFLDEGFTGGVPQSGLRPESFAHLRGGGGAVHGGDPTFKIRADGGVQIVDGRHRITLARERGDSTIRARVLVEGSRGGIKLDAKALDLKLGQAAQVGEQRLAPTGAAAKQAQTAAEKLAEKDIKAALKAHGVKATGDVRATMKELFGRIPHPDEIRGALGLKSLGKLGKFRGDAEFHPLFGITFRGGTSNGAVSISRKFGKDSSGVWVKHESLFLSKAAQGQKLGAAVVREQVGAYEKLGVHTVSLNSAEVGRYYWPKVGFDDPMALKGAKERIAKWMANQGVAEAEAIAAAPKTMHELATLRVGDRKIGKEFLLHDDYGGNYLQLDLSPNSEGLAIFKREVGLP